MSSKCRSPNSSSRGSRRRASAGMVSLADLSRQSVCLDGAVHQHRRRHRNLCDLRGKRVGVPDYVMTAGFGSEYSRSSTPFSPMKFPGSSAGFKSLSHGGLLGMDSKPPAGVSSRWLTAAETFDVMLDKGEIDAAYGFAPRHDPKLMTLNIDRYGGTSLEGNPRLRKLFADGGLSNRRSVFTKKPASFRPIMSSSPSAACWNKIPGWRANSCGSLARANASLTR